MTTADFQADNDLNYIEKCKECEKRDKCVVAKCAETTVMTCGDGYCIECCPLHNALTGTDIKNRWNSMRIFEKNYKTNYIDHNDILVGFDSQQDCCESFGHRWTYKPEFSFVPSWEDECKPEPANLEALVFDIKFFKREDHKWGGGRVMFRLVVPELLRIRNDKETRRIQRQFLADGMLTEAYLILFNHHNGYYSHGFEVTVGGNVIRNESI